MTSTLPRVTHEHHERLMSHVDHLPDTAELLLHAPVDELDPRLAEISELFDGLLIPHLEAAEANLYPELERLMQNRHSMSPMRQEHAAIRRRVEEYATLRTSFEGRRPSVSEAVAMRRILYRLYALLKIHLVEEEIYIHLIERGVEPDAAEMLAAAMDHPVVVH
jgi:hypothetical protein